MHSDENKTKNNFACLFVDRCTPHQKKETQVRQEQRNKKKEQQMDGRAMRTRQGNVLKHTLKKRKRPTEVLLKQEERMKRERERKRERNGRRYDCDLRNERRKEEC
mmetsp:Transcript_12773/g.24921  ORF Transcript_12773/g.24921 Transcript_12773/m.24921 type:complete len:106 (-) Transcript_12773:688-1005(-)